MSAAPVAADAFKEAMSRLPGPVTVVTALAPEGPHATTVSAVSALSAAPPLVVVALDRGSDLLALVRERRRFAVNLLAPGQEPIALRCARKGPGKLDGVAWSEQAGSPRIAGAALWIACELFDEHDGGDHVVLQGLVLDSAASDEPALTYYRRQFLAAALQEAS